MNEQAIVEYLKENFQRDAEIMSFRKPNSYEIDRILQVCAILLLIIAIFLLIPAIDSSLKEIHNERNTYQNEKI